MHAAMLQSQQFAEAKRFEPHQQAITAESNEQCFDRKSAQRFRDLSDVDFP